MSVRTRRLAAAQRTAAVTSPSRAKRLGAWIIIVPALSLFTFSIVANAAGLRSGSDVAKTAKQVIQERNGDKKSEHGRLVVVDSSHDEDAGGLFGDHGREVCWISTSQLNRVSAAYRTSISSITVGGARYSLVTVFGANTQDLRSLLGAPAVQCRLVHREHLFFLPFDPNLS